jgi:hypothetical protein
MTTRPLLGRFRRLLRPRVRPLDVEWEELPFQFAPFGIGACEYCLAAERAGGQTYWVADLPDGAKVDFFSGDGGDVVLRLTMQGVPCSLEWKQVHESCTAEEDSSAPAGASSEHSCS